jgi:hypothetical protein
MGKSADATGVSMPQMARSERQTIARCFTRQG